MADRLDPCPTPDERFAAIEATLDAVKDCRHPDIQPAVWCPVCKMVVL